MGGTGKGKSAFGSWRFAVLPYLFSRLQLLSVVTTQALTDQLALGGAASIWSAQMMVEEFLCPGALRGTEQPGLYGEGPVNMCLPYGHILRDC